MLEVPVGVLLVPSIFWAMEAVACIRIFSFYLVRISFKVLAAVPVNVELPGGPRILLASG